MNRSAIHIVVSFLMIGCLMFGQLAVSFFHTAHDEHKVSFGLADGEMVVPHGEHCNVCAIDMFNHVFEIPNSAYTLAETRETCSPSFAILTTYLSSFRTSDRAPPID